MTWSYDVTVRSAINRVRERIGDTIAAKPLVQNEVIVDHLTTAGFTASTSADPTTATARQLLVASAYAARDGLGTLVRQPDRSVESLTITRRPQEYATFVEKLEELAGVNGVPLATMSAGGLSIDSDRAVICNPDYAASPFGGGEWDIHPINPSTGRST